MCKLTFEKQRECAIKSIERGLEEYKNFGSDMQYGSFLGKIHLAYALDLITVEEMVSYSTQIKNL